MSIYRFDVPQPGYVFELIRQRFRSSRSIVERVGSRSARNY